MRVFPAISATVVSTSVQQNDVRLDACVRNRSRGARNLVDDPAGVAFVVFVRHGAGFHGADVVDFGAGGGQRGEQELAVGVAGGGADAVLLVGGGIRLFPELDVRLEGIGTYGDAVAQGQDAKVLPI